MKKYEDPRTHLLRHIDRTAKRYAEGLNKAGLQPNATLTRAITERALEEAEANYIKESMDTLNSNIGVIQEGHRQRMNEIKRSGARLRMWTCPPIALLFFLLAWYSFSHTSMTGVVMGCIYCVGGSAFLLMLILGAIFDRPSR